MLVKVKSIKYSSSYSGTSGFTVQAPNVISNSVSATNYPVFYDGQVLYQVSITHYHVDYNTGGSYEQYDYNNILCAYFKESIHVEGAIYVGCDKRLKHDINVINDSEALEILRKINVYTFYYNDIINKEKTLQYNVLAQEVEEILPQAVSKDKGYLSNIMKYVKVQFVSIENNKFKMILDTLLDEIVDGTYVRFYCFNENLNEYTKQKYDILDLECIENNNTFIVDKIYDLIICYGTQDIILSVDKQVIYSLCHSGIQELDKQQLADKERITNLESKVSTLETEKQQQQTEIETLKTENATLKAIIDKLTSATSFEEFKNSL